MKRERTLQVVLVMVGLLYSFWGYLLFDNLWHDTWLRQHSDVMPMFLCLNTVLGVCLLLAVKQPAKHRLMIAYGAWSSLAHAFTMTIMSAQAIAHGTHRHTVSDKVVTERGVGAQGQGRVEVATFNQLVRKADRRLLRLRERLAGRYEQFNGNELLARVLAEPQQMPLTPIQ